ncbi:unnamed protein product [Arabis nemorensis]|uniref:Uncharacterized protein n=1 Tax=Arabis nemorensis TaxID=586526 RepID=A0A565AXI6_9BRAS|nr:unnamed protein product [Arabis nemorensis]
MLILHRVHLEMLYSNPLNQVGVHGPTDLMLADPPTGDVGGTANNIVLPETTNNEVGHQFGDVGMNLLDTYMQPTVGNTYSGIDDAMFFWEGLMSQGYPPEEKFFVCSHRKLDTSSTGSSSDICIMADFESEHDLAILPTQSHGTAQLLPSEERVEREGISDDSPIQTTPQIIQIPNQNGTAEPFLGLTLTCGPLPRTNDPVVGNADGGNSSEGSGPSLGGF